MRPFRFPNLLSAVSLLAASLLAGCGSSGTSTTSSSSSTPIPVSTPPYVPPVGNYTGGLFTGQVLAGTSPVVGATVQLYSAGTTGNGSAPTQLLATGLTTDATGTFNENVAYTCPYNTSVLFLVATGGHVGSNAANAGITLMSSPGACSAVTGTPKYILNEATTVASAYAFAQLLGAGGQLGASSTNASGITLAAGTLAKLVGITTGAVSQTNGTAPAVRIGSLSNALHACLVSTGTSSSACVGLYAAAAANGIVPGNTLDAALNIAQHPGNNVATVLALSLGSAAFSPALTDTPSDWTLFVTYTGGGMNDPSSVSIDSQGRVWVSSYVGAASLFTNAGTAVFPSGITGNNLYESYGGAVDAGDNFWVANQETSYGINGALGNITVFNSSGQPVAGSTGFSAGGLDFPTGISFDTTGAAWIADLGNSHLTLLNSSGTPLSGSSGYTDGSLAVPVAVAVDSKRNGYVANSSSAALVKVPADGSSFTPFATGSGGSAVAIDGSDNAWVTNYYGDSVGLVSAAGKILSNGGFVGGGIVHPQGIAIDGSGRAWVANYRGLGFTAVGGVSELASASSATPGQILSPNVGWGYDARVVEGYGIAIDASGNLWVSGFGNNTLTEFVGMATPVKTPLIGPVRVP